jgi:presenilin-like A22 family membrane protease
MKHDLKVTFYLIIIFLIAQAVGLFLLSQTIESISLNNNGVIEVKYTEPITGRPDMQGQESFTYTLVMIFIGTAILLLLIKFKLFKVWKIWFFLAVFGSLAISLSVFMQEIPAIILSLLLTYFKIFRPNVFIHNMTEVFMYAGITILIAPMFTVFWAFLLLIAISIYDALAVWKLKHMITLATAQADQKMFAGLLIPYKRQEPEKPEMKIKETKSLKSTKKTEIKLTIPKGINKGEIRSAILGGGDIAFPLFFSGSVMTWLIQTGMQKEIALFEAMIVSLFAGIALFILLLKGEKNKFYPAMPFISAGCFIGYGIIRIIMLF